MTHTPPVPPGNQSPYPLQEPPHDASSAAPADVIPKSGDSQDLPAVSGTALGIGLAIGLGSAALLAAWFFSGEKKAKPQRRAAAARKPRAKTASTSRRAKSSARTTAGRTPSTRRRKPTNDTQ